MKIIVTLCSGIIMAGVAYSLYNAANDYGLATISLPPAIIAQDDDTSGGDETNGGPLECDNDKIICNSYLYRKVIFIDTVSDNTGKFNVFGVEFSGCKKNTKYTVRVVEFKCKINEGGINVCVRAEEKIEVCRDKIEADKTNGDSTNNVNYIG